MAPVGTDRLVERYAAMDALSPEVTKPKRENADLKAKIKTLENEIRKLKHRLRRAEKGG